MDENAGREGSFYENLSFDKGSSDKIYSSESQTAVSSEGNVHILIFAPGFPFTQMFFYETMLFPVLFACMAEEQFFLVRKRAVSKVNTQWVSQFVQLHSHGFTQLINFPNCFRFCKKYFCGKSYIFPFVIVTTDLQEAKKVRRPSLKMMRRRLSSSSGFRRQHSRDEEQSNTATADCKKQENEAYNHSPETRRKNMCSSCSLKNEQPLSPDRNEWPIHKIETSYYEEICKLLDIKDRSSLSICAVLGCFPQTEAKAIEQQFKNGTGVANKALSIWGASNRANNVGALKKIFEEKRYDVFEEIEKWEKIPVCHGCGVKL